MRLREARPADDQGSFAECIGAADTMPRISPHPLEREGD